MGRLNAEPSRMDGPATVIDVGKIIRALEEHKGDSKEDNKEMLKAEIEQLRELISQLRLQLFSITDTMRHWKSDHEEDNFVEGVFSLYDKLQNSGDLRQHWILYRRAMEVYLEKYKLYLEQHGPVVNPPD